MKLLSLRRINEYLKSLVNRVATLLQKGRSLEESFLSYSSYFLNKSVILNQHKFLVPNFPVFSFLYLKNTHNHLIGVTSSFLLHFNS
jgi:hypothetical protein